MTELRFTGDWSTILVFVLAIVAAGVCWLTYRREMKRREDSMRWVLPALRSAAAFLLVLMLAGPVLHHTKRIGELARVILVADASQSMNLRDKDLDVGRKLVIAKKLGWVDAAILDDSFARAADAMSRTRDAVNAPPSEAIKTIKTEADTALKLLEKSTNMSGRIRSEIVGPADELSKNLGVAKAQETKDGLAKIGQTAGAMENILRALFASQFNVTNDLRLSAAIVRFDGQTRWQRLQAELLDGENPPLKRLVASHDVEIALMHDDKLEPLWQSHAGRNDAKAGETPVQLGARADARLTDLNLAMTAADDANHPESASNPVQRATAIVLLSDGKHNAGESPVQRSKILGSRGVKLFAVGYGATNKPGDLAVVGVVNAKQVFFKDRVRGTVTIKDDMPPGKPFTVRVASDGETLFEKELTTQGSGTRLIDCDFPIEKLAEKLKRAGGDDDVSRGTLQIAASVEVSKLDGDCELSNNSWPMRFSATLQKRRMLVVEGRSRWEWRYIRNMFDRDDQWEVTSALVDQGELPRGDKGHAFPTSREGLFSYDLVVFGEVPARVMHQNELEWLRDFVADRAGGLIIIDGDRKELAGYSKTPFAALSPVEWLNGELGAKPSALKLTSAGEATPALRLNVGTPVPGVPANFSGLTPPVWIANVRALPGSEVLAEAVVGATNIPALVLRRVGAGRVLYSAFDESWRWRQPEPELVHQRYWRQIALAIMEAPFAIHDKRVSLDTDSTAYRPGQKAEIRARLRDENGKPLAKAEAFALLSRDGQIVASVPLAADEGSGGLFHAKTGSLAEGEYEVRIALEGVPDGEMKARTKFRVAAADVGELTDLGCDEPLLRELVGNANGGFFREENLDDVIARIAPMSSGRIEESETKLWQSYWWFGTIIGLLAAEWILRKRAGLL